MYTCVCVLCVRACECDCVLEKGGRWNGRVPKVVPVTSQISFDTHDDFKLKLSP